MSFLFGAVCASRAVKDIMSYYVSTRAMAESLNKIEVTKHPDNNVVFTKWET